MKLKVRTMWAKSLWCHHNIACWPTKVSLKILFADYQCHGITMWENCTYYSSIICCARIVRLCQIFLSLLNFFQRIHFHLQLPHLRRRRRFERRCCGCGGVKQQRCSVRLFLREEEVERLGRHQVQSLLSQRDEEVMTAVMKALRN